MGVALLLIAFVGFARSYFLSEWNNSPPLRLTMHVHGVLATAFMLLLVAQTMLVGTRRPALHRRVGVFGVMLAMLFFVSSFPAGVAMLQIRGASDEAISRFALPFVAAPVFAMFFAAAVHFCRPPEIHKRMMLLAMIEAVTPALARLPVPAEFMAHALLLSLLTLLAAFVLRDLIVEGRAPAASLWGVALLLASLPARGALGRADAWHALVRDMLGNS